MSVAALVLAAGRGERLGAGLPKALVPLAGKPLLLHAVEAIASCSEVGTVIPVVSPDALGRFREVLAPLRGGAVAEPVAGGRERQESVARGLEALPEGTELVAVHDAARPFVEAGDVRRAIDAARRSGAAILAVPVPDTIKRVREGRVIETPPREECWAAQTPQVFRVELLRAALARAEREGFLATDDAQLVERLGAPVVVVEGSPRNLKITWPEDLVRAEAWLARERAAAT